MRGIRHILGLALLCASACGSARADGAPQEALNSLDLAAMSPQAQVFAPRAKSQVSGARIGWEIENVRSAFRQSSIDGLPVIIVADGADGGFFANVLRCPTFNTLAGQAHFILIPLPIADENSDAARLLNALHMDTTFKSTVSVLDLRDRQVNEVLRLTGYHGEADLLAKLEDTGLSPARPNPLPLSSVALGSEKPRDCEGSVTR